MSQKQEVAECGCSSVLNDRFLHLVASAPKNNLHLLATIEKILTAYDKVQIDQPLEFGSLPDRIQVTMNRLVSILRGLAGLMAEEVLIFFGQPAL